MNVLKRKEVTRIYLFLKGRVPTKEKIQTSVRRKRRSTEDERDREWEKEQTKEKDNSLSHEV